MKKYLIILLCLVGLSGCIMIYPSSITHEGYFLPAKPQLYTDLNDEFDEECQDISEYIVESAKNQDLKQYLTDRGADCDTTENVCYFYFARGRLIEVSQFNLLSKAYQQLFAFPVQSSLDKINNKGIEINFTRYMVGGCGIGMSIPDQNKLATELEQKVEGIINASK
jgi:hypothetical protein